MSDQLLIPKETAVKVIMFGVNKCKYFADRVNKMVRPHFFENEDQLREILTNESISKLSLLMGRMYY